MLGVSTSWKSTELDNGKELFNSIERLSVLEIELEYRITDLMFHQMRSLVKKSDIQVVSIHNYFPVPPVVEKSMASGDLFYLSNPDKDQRAQAVRWSLRTIECANDMEAGAVVLHCGRVEMEPELGTLYHFLDEDKIDCDEAREFISGKIAERERKKPQYLDALMFGLEPLIKAAEAHNVLLGLENRYFYHELPGPDDFEMLFSEFNGAPLRYWHDIGHAQVNESLSFVTQEALLKRYADHLIGVHYHDVKGREDHLPPGQGKVDFTAIKPHLKDNTIGILEVKPGTPDLEVMQGLEVLRNQGIG